MSFLSRWRPRHLLGAWFLYWVALIPATLWNVIVHVRRVTQPDHKGSFSLDFGDGRFTARVVDAGRTVVASSASLVEVVLWVAGPPLVLFVLWLFARPRREALPAQNDVREIGGAPFDGVDVRARDRADERTPDRDRVP